MQSFYSKNWTKEWDIKYVNIDWDIYEAKCINISNLNKEDFDKAIKTKYHINTKDSYSDTNVIKHWYEAENKEIKESIISIIRNNKTFDDVVSKIEEYYKIEEFIDYTEKWSSDWYVWQWSFKVWDLKIYYNSDWFWDIREWQELYITDDWNIKINTKN